MRVLNELVLTFGGSYTSVPVLMKIDQEMRPWECPQTDTHWQTERRLSHAICYSYGTNNKKVTTCICIFSLLDL